MQSAPTPDAQSPSAFGWGAAVIGGVVAIGGAALFGTIITVIALRVAMSNGVSREQAYAVLAASHSGLLALLTLSAAAFSCALGGYVSAKYGKGRPLTQAAAAGGISLLFFGAMYLNPASTTNPVWFVASTIVLPLVSSVAGGWVHARRI